MAYSNFKSIAEVARKFDLKVMDAPCIDEKSMQIPELYFAELEKRLRSSIHFINEITICETIIRPILDIVANEYSNLKVWSHVTYNVDAENGLFGEPDYLIAPRTKYGDMARPAICIIEAKQEKFEEGWAQALAEMVASSLLKADVCYCAVTNGKIWEFGSLNDGCFIRHPIQLSASYNLQKTFNVLNWIFYKCSVQYTSN
jgi:hypothetical protein